MPVIRRFILFLLLCLAVPLFGQQPVVLPGDSLLRTGIHQMFNFRRAEAVRNFLAVQSQYPRHPAGYFLEGAAAWMMVRGTHGVHASEDTLLARMQESAEISRAYVKDHPGDAFGWLFYGMSLGAQARVDLARQHWLQAAVHGYKGIRRIKKAEKLNPDLPDLRLAMGAFHYYVGMSGPVLKAAAGIIGLSGTREEGLQELEYAAQHGRYGPPQANEILMYIYGYLEDQVPKAVHITKQMETEYPRSPYYVALTADLQFSLGETEQAGGAIETLQPMIATLDTFYAEEYQNKVVYLQGLQSYHRGEFSRAVTLLDRFLRDNVDEYDFFAINAQLTIGKCYQRLDQPVKARIYYREVAGGDMPNRMKTEAEQLLEQVWKR